MKNMQRIARIEHTDHNMISREDAYFCMLTRGVDDIEDLELEDINSLLNGWLDYNPYIVQTMDGWTIITQQERGKDV